MTRLGQFKQHLRGSGLLYAVDRVTGEPRTLTVEQYVQLTATEYERLVVSFDPEFIRVKAEQIRGRHVRAS